jgi:hypothetical protein
MSGRDLTVLDAFNGLKGLKNGRIRLFTRAFTPLSRSIEFKMYSAILPVTHSIELRFIYGMYWN